MARAYFHQYKAPPPPKPPKPAGAGVIGGGYGAVPEQFYSFMEQTMPAWLLKAGKAAWKWGKQAAKTYQMTVSPLYTAQSEAARMGYTPGSSYEAARRAFQAGKMALADYKRFLMSTGPGVMPGSGILTQPFMYYEQLPTKEYEASQAAQQKARLARYKKSGTGYYVPPSQQGTYAGQGTYIPKATTPQQAMQPSYLERFFAGQGPFGPPQPVETTPTPSGYGYDTGYGGYGEYRYPYYNGWGRSPDVNINFGGNARSQQRIARLYATPSPDIPGWLSSLITWNIG